MRKAARPRTTCAAHVSTSPLRSTHAEWCAPHAIAATAGAPKFGGGASGDEPGLPAPALMKAFKLLAEAKTAAVGEWIKEALIDGDPTGGKVLIFAHHHSVHDRLAEALRKALGWESTNPRPEDEEDSPQSYQALKFGM